MTRLTVDDVLEYAHGISFKTGPPGSVGVETEWQVVDEDDDRRHVPLDEVRELVTAAGPPPRGSGVTYEPGGQLELSSLPQSGVAECHTALRDDLAHVTSALAERRLGVRGHGVDPVRPPRLQLDTGRYACMAAFFAARGEPGDVMMCSTASVQVCLDIGRDAADAARRWHLAGALGPALVAAFANSPVRAGRPTGWRSTRQAVWAALDSGRTRAPACDPGAALGPAESWARYALDSDVMAIRREGWEGGAWIADPGMTFRDWLGGSTWGYPDHDDLVFHLSTLFPPVRPRGWLELRMIDAVPRPYWPVVLAVATALLDDPVAADIAAEAVEPVATAWPEAARDAMADPALARCVRTLFEAALAALPRIGAPAELTRLVADYADRYVARGRCPADDVLAAPYARGSGSEETCPRTLTR
ncbi:MAG TPA: ergothioneine biosynthesis glutamate--cysteine ligase EgtA [Streptosporangiaceae bacterium]|jgi:glutamate--cysteine ligase